jgi:hypothetical protein
MSLKMFSRTYGSTDCPESIFHWICPTIAPLTKAAFDYRGIIDYTGL